MKKRIMALQHKNFSSIFYIVFASSVFVLLLSGVAFYIIELNYSFLRVLLSFLVPVIAAVLFVLVFNGSPKNIRRHPLVFYIFLLSSAAALIFYTSYIYGSCTESGWATIWVIFLLSAAGSVSVYICRSKGLLAPFIAVLMFLPIYVGAYFTCSPICFFITLFTSLFTLIIASAVGFFGSRRTFFCLESLIFTVLLITAGFIVFKYEAFDILSKLRSAFTFEPDSSGAGYCSMITRSIISGAHFISGVHIGENVKAFPLYNILSSRVITYIIWKYGFLPAILLLLIFALMLSSGYLLCRGKKSLSRCMAFSSMSILAFFTFNYAMQCFGLEVFFSRLLPFFTLGISANSVCMILATTVFLASVDTAPDSDMPALPRPINNFFDRSIDNLLDLNNAARGVDTISVELIVFPDDEEKLINLFSEKSTTDFSITKEDILAFVSSRTLCWLYSFYGDISAFEINLCALLPPVGPVIAQICCSSEFAFHRIKQILGDWLESTVFNSIKLSFIYNENYDENEFDISFVSGIYIE